MGRNCAPVAEGTLIYGIFFGKYQFDSNTMSIAYCSTEHTLADFFTKY